MKRFVLPPRSWRFVLLSLADLGLTWWLLRHSGRVITEINPIADWWLSRYGWPGLAGFKVLTLGVVIVLAALIARSRPRTAGHVLGFGCAVLAFVLLYSAAVGGTAPTPEEFTARINRDWNEQNRQAQPMGPATIAYETTRACACRDLIAANCTLAEAVQRLMSLAKNQGPARQRPFLVLMPGHSEEEFLALEFIRLVREADAAPARTAALEQQYGALFGVRAGPGLMATTSPSMPPAASITSRKPV